MRGGAGAGGEVRGEVAHGEGDDLNKARKNIEARGRGSIWCMIALTHAHTRTHARTS